MSLGHKRTFAVQKAMSALPLRATEKADIRKTACLLYPPKRTIIFLAQGFKRVHGQASQPI